jgi:glycosyltransferase involved in cell wall biosynthesis
VASERDDITLVVPTYNRAAALQANLASMLAMRDIAEVVVVDDGSTDDTLQVCEQFVDERLKVVRHEANRGLPAARNTGLAAARGEWVVFGEDDCRFPIDYATVLRAEAHRHAADIVGAPLLHLKVTDQEVPALAAKAPRVEKLSMENGSVFPTRAVETPFIPAVALVRRSVFERVHYYEGFSANAYREETDFFVQAARAGFSCLLTGETYCYQLENWDGGARQSSTLRYEYWVLRNNWRFLRRHTTWLIEHGYIRGAVRAQLGFTGTRVATVLSGATRARIRRVRSAAARRGAERRTVE